MTTPADVLDRAPAMLKHLVLRLMDNQAHPNIVELNEAPVEVSQYASLSPDCIYWYVTEDYSNFTLELDYQVDFVQTSAFSMIKMEFIGLLHYWDWLRQTWSAPLVRDATNIQIEEVT